MTKLSAATLNSIALCMQGAGAPCPHCGVLSFEVDNGIGEDLNYLCSNAECPDVREWGGPMAFSAIDAAHEIEDAALREAAQDEALDKAHREAPEVE